MWLAVAVPEAGTVAPSPKSNAYERVCPCGSVDAEASADTCNGDVPVDGVTVSDAVGGRSGGGGAETVTTFWSVAVSPDVLVTVTVSVYVPAAV